MKVIVEKCKPKCLCRLDDFLSGINGYDYNVLRVEATKEEYVQILWYLGADSDGRMSGSHVMYQGICIQHHDTYKSKFFEVGELTK